MDTKLNKSDFILLAIIYGVTVILNTYEYYRVDNALIEYLVDIPAGIIVSFSVVIIFFYWLIPEFLFKKKRIIIFATLGVLVLAVLGMIDYTLGFWSGGNDWNKFPTPLSLFVEGIFDASTDGGFTFGILLAKKFYEGRTKFLTIEKQQKENELKLLRAQLDPHFLFNNLNTLDALIDTDSKKAKEYINRLALIYRYLIQTKDNEVMELEAELKTAENYIFLIQTRFENDYEFIINKNSNYTDKFLPTGTLQTVIENVVKHNKVINNGSVTCTVTITNDSVCVINNKTGSANTKSLGTGLKNLIARYKHLTEETVIIEDTDANFSITLPIIKLIE